MSVLALILTALLLLAAGALRAAGASLVRTSRADALHDAAEGDEAAERVAAILEDRAVVQPAIGTVSSTLLVAAALPASWALTELVSGWWLVAALVAMGITLVLVGDVLPRSWGRSRPKTLAYRFSGLLATAVTLGQRAVDLIEDEPEEGESEEEERNDEEERQLISSVLEFTDAICREIMVPRPDMVTVSRDTSTDAALDVIIEEGFSRIPVTRDGPDDIMGVVYAKDLMKRLDAGAEPVAVSAAMRPAYFVPETKRASELLREMQKHRVHMAIAVDEFGGTAGLVTIEDILEELVGEIEDEYDTEEQMSLRLDDGGYLVDARMAVDDLGELLDLELPEDEWDTVGGLVLALAGRVPKEGEAFDYDGITLTADRVQGRRVARVRAHRR